jgi:hypothetical protein
VVDILLCYTVREEKLLLLVVKQAFKDILTGAALLGRGGGNGFEG